MLFTYDEKDWIISFYINTIYNINIAVNLCYGHLAPNIIVSLVIKVAITGEETSLHIITTRNRQFDQMVSLFKLMASLTS